MMVVYVRLVFLIRRLFGNYFLRPVAVVTKQGLPIDCPGLTRVENHETIARPAIYIRWNPSAPEHSGAPQIPSTINNEDPRGSHQRMRRLPPNDRKTLKQNLIDLSVL